MTVWRIVLTALTLAVIQLATFSGYFLVSVMLITLFAVAYGGHSIATKQVHQAFVWGVFAAIGMAALIAGTVWANEDALRIIAQTPTVAIYVIMCVAFGRTLGPETEPLITRFRRLDGMPLTEPMLRYTRRLTWIWTALFGSAAIVTMTAVVVSQSAQGSLAFSLGIMPIAMLVLFVAEHFYRALHYGRSEWASPWRTAKLFFKADAWNPS